MIDIYALAKKIYNIPISELLDELYRQNHPSSGPAFTITPEGHIQFLREVEFKASQTLSQDSGVKKSQLDNAVNGASNSASSSGLILSTSDW